MTMNRSSFLSAPQSNPWTICLFALIVWALCGTINVESACADKPTVKIQKKSKSKSQGNQKFNSVPTKKTGVGFPSPYGSNRGSSNQGNRNKQSTRLNFSNDIHGSRSNNFRQLSGHNHNNRGSNFGIHLNLSPYNSFPYGGTSPYFWPSYGDFGTFGGGYGLYNSYPSYISPSYYPYATGTSSYYSSGPIYDTYSVPSYGGSSTYPTPLNYAPQYDIANPGINGTPVLTGPETAARNEMMYGSTPQPGISSGPNYVKIPTSASARSFQSRAEEAFKYGDYTKAATLAEQALAQDPNNGKLRLFVSHADFAVGNFVKSVHHLDQATRSLSSDQWGVVVKNFRDFYGKNDYVSQTDRLNREIASRPTPGTLSLRGYHYGSLGYAEAATVDFQRALAIDPGYKLAERLLPVLGIPPQPIAPEDIQAPMPVAVPDAPNGILPLKPASQLNRLPDGIIRLVPQSTDAESEAAVPAETGKSILLDGPSK